MNYINKIKNKNSSMELNEIIKTSRVFQKNGKINIDYRLNEKYILTGKERIRFSTGFSITKRNLQKCENESFELALDHYLKNSGMINPNEIYLKDLAMEALEEDKDNRAEDTHEDYIKIYEKYILPTFGNILLVDVKAKDIKSWKNNLLKEKQFSKSRFTKYYRTLNFILKYAYVNEYIDKNPMDLVDKKSKAYKESNIKKSMKYYSKTEVQKILEKAEGWFKTYLTTLLYTGMRTGESIALKWSDLDFENNTITIQRSSRHGKIRNSIKTGIINVIDMAEPVKQALIKYFDEAVSTEWIFPNPQTLKPYWEPKSIINSQLKPLLKKLGIEYKTLYATRHSYASNMVENNIPLTYVQKQLGHKKLSTTMDFYVKNGLMSEEGRDIRIDTLYS